MRRTLTCLACRPFNVLPLARGRQPFGMCPLNRLEFMKTLILSGFGTNCEKETLFACRRSGGEEVETRHINEIYEGAFRLGDYRFLIFIGRRTLTCLACRPINDFAAGARGR